MLEEKEDMLVKTIRNAMAINPFVTIRAMQGMVEKNTGRSISDKYVSKLMYKIRRQAVVQSDRTLMNERLAQLRERNRVLLEDLYRIIYWRHDYLNLYGVEMPKCKDKIAAMRLVAQLDAALFRTELLAGAFESQNGATVELKEHIGFSRTVRLQPILGYDSRPEPDLGKIS